MSKIVEQFKTTSNLSVNNEKTQELVEKLKRDCAVVATENVGDYLRKNGLVVQEHIGRRRNGIRIEADFFGVNVKLQEESRQEFLKEHINAGILHIIPESYEKKLQSIEGTVRNTRKKYAIGYDDKFLSLESYDAFAKLVEEKKAEYFAVRDEILNQWDAMVFSFTSRLREWVDQLKIEEREVVYRSIVSRIPTKEDYEKSFYMYLNVKAFPVMENLDMFPEQIQKQIKDGLNDDTIGMLYDVIGTTLNDAFNTVAVSVIKAVEKREKIHQKSITAIKNMAKRIGQKNIFHNDKIESLRKEIATLPALANDRDAIAEAAEIIMAKIYGYAKHLELDVDISQSHMTKKELLEIYAMVEGEFMNPETDTMSGGMQKVL